jgi:uncharacterized protein (TIGR02265 family)
MPSLTQASQFEGMFVRALQPQGAFLEELRRLGYDPQKPEPAYPTELWIKSLEVAQRHRYPGTAPSQCLRQLGRDFARGFLDTLVGKVIGVGLPLLGPVRALKRLPSYVTTTRNDVSVAVVAEADRRIRMRVADPFPVPEFFAGIIEVGLERAGVQATVTTENAKAGHYDMVASW